VRGWGGGGEKRRGQLKDLLNKNRVDVFCLQETMKRELLYLTLEVWLMVQVSHEIVLHLVAALGALLLGLGRGR
jgi:hypothetical protein